MPLADMDSQQWDVLQRLLYDHDFFCRHIVKIEPKDIQFTELDVAQFEALWREDSTAGLVPYIKRPGQRAFQAAADQMLAEVGYVALGVVKPRQVGWSTEIQSRAYWKCTKTPGLKVLIVSHTRDSTGKFLRRMRKMCAAAPESITPGRPVENTKEIVFANNAQVTIATAGSPDAVRSDNAHFFHGSEETSWENAAEVAASIYPALSFSIGSEAYRETTSKGRETPWHKFVQQTLENFDPKTGLWTQKTNRWRIFFDPYHNDPRYQTEPPPGWEPNEEALIHAEMHLKHKSREEQLRRLYWRHMMIADLGALWLFKQEYPSTIDESFQASKDTLYPPDAVYRAAANGKNGTIALDPYAPLIMGVDPARSGDRTAICFRQGKVIREVMVWDKMDDMQLVGIIARFLANGYNGKKVAKCFIDYAIGEGAASRLRELGFSRQVDVIHFGAQSSEPRYANKRAEMYMNMRDWFGDTGEHVSIPNEDRVTGDLLAIPDFVQQTGSEKIKIKPKDEIKKSYGKSVDIADACALTFAYEVAGERPAELQRLAREFMSHAKPSEVARVLSDFDR
jgi:hypothetical protein